MGASTSDCTSFCNAVLAEKMFCIQKNEEGSQERVHSMKPNFNSGNFLIKLKKIKLTHLKHKHQQTLWVFNVAITGS